MTSKTKLTRVSATRAALPFLLLPAFFAGCVTHTRQKTSAAVATRPMPAQQEAPPYSDVLGDGGRWDQMQERERMDPEARWKEEAAANAEAAAKLQTEINEPWTGIMTLDNSLPFFGQIAGVTILVNWKAIEEVGIKRDASILVAPRKISLDRFIREALRQLSTDKVTLGYTLDDGVVTISTQDDLESPKYQTIRVFDIRDLVIDPLPAKFELPVPGEVWKAPTKEEQAAQHAASLAQIIDTLETIVAPTSWRDRGGKIGTIRELNGQLIVNQLPENQAAILRLLTQLRDARAIQISLESRIYTVTPAAYAALVPQYPALAEKGEVSALDEKQTLALIHTLDADPTATTPIPPRITAFNGQVATIVPPKSPAAEVIQTSASSDRKSVALHMKVGMPTNLAKPAGDRTETELLTSIPDGATALINARKTKGQTGDDRQILLLVRPKLITQREIESGDIPPPKLP